MNKLILIIGILLYSCGPTREELIANGYDPTGSKKIDADGECKTYKIDSCEYIVCRTSWIGDAGISIIHKANCKNH